jgi:tRNA-specific 2-thiouridylase
MEKPAVRVLAEEHDLAVAQKPDSQEICFIPGGDYKTFLNAYLDEQGQEMPDTAGDLVSTSGEVLGHHGGIHSFTVGQRKGVQQNLNAHAASPFYVLSIDAATHNVTIGSDEDLLTRNARIDRLNWISIPELTEPLRVQAKVRHRHEPAPATLSAGEDGTAVLLFDEPQRAVTPGQAAVFYQNDEVVGGGWIF